KTEIFPQLMDQILLISFRHRPWPVDEQGKSRRTRVGLSAVIEFHGSALRQWRRVCAHDFLQSLVNRRGRNFSPVIFDHSHSRLQELAYAVARRGRNKRDRHKLQEG